MTDKKSQREPLPFEPRSQKRKTAKRPPVAARVAEKTASKTNKSWFAGIPEEVSQRMARRMALFSGIPTAFGMFSFIAAYWIVSHKWLELPTAVVLFTSLGFFGLGVLGLSYGIFSTSWDEKRPGGWWGWQEFRANFGSTVRAWRSGREEINSN